MPWMARTPTRLRLFLALGDLMVVALTALAGFAQHGSLSGAGASRLAATVVPFAVAWFAAAAALGCFEAHRTPTWRDVWRPLLAAILSAPLGAVLRGLWLGASVIPVFAVVMAAVLGAAMTAWRALAALALRRWPSAAL